MIYTSFDDFFTVLGSKQRVRILQFLNREGSKNVSDIGEKLQIEQSAVSHDMKKLLDCHFVSVKRSGKERIYEINEETIRPLFNLIRKHIKNYCKDEPEHWK